MSMLELGARVTVGSLIAELEAKGAKVSWEPGREPAIGTTTVLEVEIDAQAAFEALPPHWFEPEDLTFRVPDARDVGDFVAACLSGDRTTAAALIPRLLDDIAVQDAAERALRYNQGAVH